MAEPIRYVVLTEAADRHHVAIARSAPATGWVQIVGTFDKLDRAERYAEVENDCYDGQPWGDEAETPPKRDEVPTGLSKVVEMVERRSETRSVTYTASTGGVRPISALCDEVMEELPLLLEQNPKGPTAKAFAQRLQVEEQFVRKALRQIERDGRAALVTRKDSPAHHLVPVGYEGPPEALTPTQEMVLSVLRENADDQGYVRMSRKLIGDKAIVSAGTIGAVLDALVGKGRIVQLERGDASVATLYQIVNVSETAAQEFRHD